MTRRNSEKNQLIVSVSLGILSLADKELVHLPLKVNVQRERSIDVVIPVPQVIQRSMAGWDVVTFVFVFILHEFTTMSFSHFHYINFV